MLRVSQCWQLDKKILANWMSGLKSAFTASLNSSAFPSFLCGWFWIICLRAIWNFVSFACFIRSWIQQEYHLCSFIILIDFINWWWDHLCLDHFYLRSFLNVNYSHGGGSTVQKTRAIILTLTYKTCILKQYSITINICYIELKQKLKSIYFTNCQLRCIILLTFFLEQWIDLVTRFFRDWKFTTIFFDL